MKLVRSTAIAVCLTLLLCSGIALPQPEPAHPPDTTEPQAKTPVDEQDSDADPTAICLGAFSASQAHRREGNLLEARRELILCSQSHCPDEIVGKCTPWLREVQTAMPSIIVVVRDSDGRDTLDVSITIDGAAIDPALHGRPVEMNPGAHVVVVQPREGKRVELPLVVVHFQKNRVVTARLEPPRPSPVPTPPQPPPPAPDTTNEAPGISPWAWVGLSVGGAALVAGTVLGVLALDAADELETTCAGLLCSSKHKDEYRAGKRLAHASTTLLIAGGAIAAFGIVALIWLGDDTPPAAVGVGVHGLTIGGQF